MRDVRFHMFDLETHSLKAISKLEAEFPYAATLLTYAVLERCLRTYLLKNRHILTPVQVDLNKKAGRGGPTLKAVRHLDDDSFIDQFLVNCTLGTLEYIYKVSHKKYSASRNKVFHSQLYLREQRSKNHQDRDAGNRKYLKEGQAKSD